MAACMKHCKQFLVQFAHEHLEFRIPELQSLANLYGQNLTICEPMKGQSPYLVIDLPSEELAKEITGRAVLVKSAYELWAAAPTYEDLHKKLTCLPKSVSAPFIRADSSFRVRLDSFNKLVEQKEKLQKIDNVLSGAISFDGKINLTQPDHSFHILEYYETDADSGVAKLDYIYFARWICDGHRRNIQKLNLKKRKFIANTSMDPGLSLVMANMGQARPNSLVFDPFVGSGSLSVSSAHYGAYVMGTDIDWKLLSGIGRSSRHNQQWRGADETIRANLAQYGLEHRYLDALVADASLHALWRPRAMFDAIVTDPPYGIREKTEKLGTHKEESSIPDEMRAGHIPSKIPYQLTQILCDLLVFSARSLRLGGRLVYWLPVYRDQYVEENIPSHPCFEMVANCEQPLSKRIARRLITMTKVKDVEDGDLAGAAVVEDHYKDASFREKYFKQLS